MFAPRFYTTIWPIDAARACPFACSSLRFRRFCSGSLALASLNLTCRNLVPTFPQRSPPLLLITAACGGLRSAPDCRPRRTYLHLSYSYAAPFGPAILVTQDPIRTLPHRSDCAAPEIEPRQRHRGAKHAQASNLAWRIRNREREPQVAFR